MRIIGGTYKNHRLKTPKKLTVRPTPEALRETLFNILQNRIEGARILDLFAGTGAISIEAVSRGAQAAVCVENGKEALQCLSANIAALDLQKSITVVRTDAIAFLEKSTNAMPAFDIIYADPPYLQQQEEGLSLAQQVLNSIDAQPLLAEDGVFFLEHSKEMPVSTESLKNLVLHKERRLGSTILHQYRTKTGAVA